jgi:hypothetical protein
LNEKLAPVTWYREILHDDRTSNAEQLLIRPFFVKIQNTNVAGG